ncbi:hypothetical protein C7U80_21850, partial [Escherichia coli]|uniref:hypothetical protein n=1 Tax=Escherichia coli TaxID=562 RepID=UPI000D4FA6A0
MTYFLLTKKSHVILLMQKSEKDSNTDLGAKENKGNLVSCCHLEKKKICQKLARIKKYYSFVSFFSLAASSAAFFSAFCW